MVYEDLVALIKLTIAIYVVDKKKFLKIPVPLLRDGRPPL
jgi:hypothetical protein